MTRINTNIEALRGLRSVQNAGGLLSTSLQRLSTGLKINSGKDGPASLIASETLRSQLTSIDQSIKNSSRANNVISTADAALGEINNLLNQVRGLVQEGLNDGALSQSEKEANQLQIDAALSAINRISSNTQFAGDKLLDGSKSFTTHLTAADASKLNDFNVTEAIFGGSDTIEIDATITSAASRGTLFYTGGDLTQDTTLELSGARGRQVLFFGSSSTTDDIADAINAVSDVTGVEAVIESDGTETAGTATFDGTGTAATAATETFASTGDDNDILFTAVTAGLVTGTDAPSVEFVLGTDETTLGVAVSGNDITITLAVSTDDTATSISKAYEVIAAVNSNTSAAALVTASLDTSDTNVVNGQGLVSATLVTGSGTELDNGTDNYLTDNAIIITNDTEGELTSTDVVSIEYALGTSSGTDATVAVSGAAITVTLDLNADNTSLSGVAASAIVAAINANTDAAALVTASLDTSTTGYVDGSGLFNYTSTGPETVNGTDGTDVVRLSSTEFGSDQFADVNVLTGAFQTYDAAVAGNESFRSDGGDIQAIINGQAAVGRGLRASLVSQSITASVTFTETDNVDDTTATVTVTGGGSLFQIGQDVSAAGQIGIGIEAINTARLGGTAGKLYELGSGAGRSLLDVGTDVPGSELVDIINQSIDKVSTLRGRLGAIQRNVIETNISTLGSALENISEARSQIVDTDFASETSKLTQAQIINQAALSVLSIANQNPNQVLSLLR